MNEKDLDLFNQKINLAVKRAGALAKSLQGKVKNQKKEVKNANLYSKHQKEVISAKTIVDEKCQEILLQAVVEILNPKEILLDAEEDTLSVSLFSKDPRPLSLVIDPIDGTYEYLHSQDFYSINLGLIHQGKVLSSFVFFPKLDLFYFLKKNTAYLEEKPLKISSTSNTVYVTNRVKSEITNYLKNKGYKVIGGADEKMSWQEALLKCLSGEFKALIAQDAEIRDLLLGAIIEKSDGGYALDWDGNTLSWPPSGRIPKAIFVAGEYPKGILKTLKV